MSKLILDVNDLFNRQRIFCHYCGVVVVVINAGSSSSCGGIGGIGMTLPVLVVDDNNSSQFSIASNKSEDDVKVSRYSCNLGIVYIHCRLVCKQYSHVGLDSSH